MFKHDGLHDGKGLEDLFDQVLIKVVNEFDQQFSGRGEILVGMVIHVTPGH